MRILNYHPLDGLHRVWISCRQWQEHWLDDPLAWAAFIILLMILTAVILALLR